LIITHIAAQHEATWFACCLALHPQLQLQSTTHMAQLAGGRDISCLGIREDGAGYEAEVGHPDGHPDHDSTEQAQHQHPDQRQHQTAAKTWVTQTDQYKMLTKYKRKRKENTTPVGINLMKSQVLYRAAQVLTGHSTACRHALTG